MPSRLFTRAVALGAAVLAAGGLFGLAAPASAASHPSGSGKAVHAALRHRHTVLLPTGEAVSYDPARPKDLRVHTRTTSGVGHGWRSFVRAGHTYVVPVTALPFLGTVLDPSLFDVTALAKAGKHPQFTVTVAKGGGKAAVPGFTVKKRTRTTQRGTFSAKGAKQFGAALQRAAAGTRGRTAATRSLFGAALIGTKAAGPVIAPKYPQQTVIFRATGQDGKPVAEGSVFYGNLDDARRATGFAFIVDGEVRVSLPKGRYTLYSDTVDFTSETSADLSVVTQPQLDVTGQANQVVPIDFRTATATPSLTVPAATTPKDYAVIYERAWPSSSLDAFVFGDASLRYRIAPAPAPQIGSVTLTSFLRSTPTSGAAELYSAVFQQDGAISADQSHTLSAGQLADVRERVFDTGAPNPASFVQGVQLPDGSGVGFGDEAALPFERLDHRYAPEGAFWSDSVVTGATELDPFDGEIDDGLRTYAAGTSRTVDWLRQAVAPAVPTATPEDAAQGGVPCLACRTSKELAVVTAPLVDSFGSGHYGFVYDDETGRLAGHLRLYRDGRLIDDEPGSNVVYAAVPTGKAAYRVVAESTPAVAGFGYGTVARTEWTFSSSAASGAAVPTDRCLVGGKGTCRVLPLLKVVAPLPVDLHQRAAVGTATFPICVGGIDGADVGTTTAAVQVSFDSGKTFTDVPLTATGPGCWSAALTNPAGAAGKVVALRITGTGSAGTAVVQTVRNAYRVAG